MVTHADKISSCYIGPVISPEQFVPEHFFLFLITGTLHGYDGSKHYTLKSGECCIVRKNHLARYNKEKENDRFEKIVVVLDEAFLKKFKSRHNQPVVVKREITSDAFLMVEGSKLITNFVGSLQAYYDDAGKIDESFADIKREELLLILLKSSPELQDILFDFDTPQKLNLKAFMNRNYRFNVSIQRFAYLTGRSLTVFKKDFEKLFHETPSRWLIQKRLDEAYFQIDKKKKKASDIYLDLGFEDLSHFSYAFKKKFGVSPTRLRV